MFVEMISRCTFRPSRFAAPFSPVCRREVSFKTTNDSDLSVRLGVDSLLNDTSANIQKPISYTCIRSFCFNMHAFFNVI